MFVEQPVANLSGLATHFPGAQLEMVRAAIVAGNTAGRLWLRRGEARETALLWDQGNNVFYLGGATLDAGSAQELRTLLAGELQPQSVATGARYFRARGLTAALDALLPRLFSGVALTASEKHFYTYPATAPPAVAVPGVDGLIFAPIDRNLLQSRLENVQDLRYEIAWMWPGSGETGLAHFLDAGLGSAAILGDRLVCWCTAEYVSADRCGIGIETDAAYRRRGIAGATTARFIAAALDRGLVPHWECDAANLPSVRVAERCGFQLLETAHFWTGLFPAPEPA
jgi:RimJ/RimL family protein N-acetyltransferase